MMPLLLLAADEEAFIFVAILSAIGAGLMLGRWGIVHWCRLREAAYNARLKQLMIERGMTAAEITSVIESGRAEPGAPMANDCRRHQHYV